MAKKITSLIGMPITELLDRVDKHDQITALNARLIPIYKLGDEMALTSLFLSALRLIKEFRREVSAAVGLSFSGQIYVFTEVTFAEFGEERPDGLILVVGGKKIKDAALLELKNKGSDLDEDQIFRYLAIAKRFGIPKLITVSNQFVSSPSQSPLSMKVPKSVSLYHLSWSYIRTLAHLLLHDNERNIDDQDQSAIMQEVVDYMEHPDSGVNEFALMKPGWKHVVAKLNSGVSLKKTDPEVLETISSWLQEERDMALLLSRKLGILVGSGVAKYKDDLSRRIDSEIQTLIGTHSLKSTHRVKGAASEINVTAHFVRRTLEMRVYLSAPKDKKLRGQIGWLQRYFDVCQRKDEKTFEKNIDEMSVDIGIKYQRLPHHVALRDFADSADELKRAEVTGFSIVQIRDLGRKFDSRGGIVKNMEEMLLEFYQAIVQHLRAWEPPAPQMPDSKDGGK